MTDCLYADVECLNALSEYLRVHTQHFSVNAFELEDNNSGSVGASEQAKQLFPPVIVQIIFSDVTTNPMVIDSLFRNFNSPLHT